MNCEKATGLVGWVLSWCYLSGQELQRVGVKWGHVRTSRNGVWEVVGAYVSCLLQAPSTDLFSMVLEAKPIKPADRDGAQRQNFFVTFVTFLCVTLGMVWWQHGSITLFRLGAWAELACICQFVLQTSPIQTQAQVWVLGHLHDEKSAARSTAQIVSLPMFWAIMSRGTWLQFTFYGSTALCPNDWELWATLNG